MFCTRVRRWCRWFICKVWWVYSFGASDHGDGDDLFDLLLLFCSITYLVAFQLLLTVFLSWTGRLVLMLHWRWRRRLFPSGSCKWPLYKGRINTWSFAGFSEIGGGFLKFVLICLEGAQKGSSDWLFHLKMGLHLSFSTNKFDNWGSE